MKVEITQRNGSIWKTSENLERGTWEVSVKPNTTRAFMVVGEAQDGSIPELVNAIMRLSRPTEGK